MALAAVRASGRLNFRSDRLTGVSSPFYPDFRRKRGIIMHHIVRGLVLAFAGLSLSIVGSSLEAQQSPPDPSTTQDSSQPATSVPPAPPPARDVAPLPPPFPPMPRSRPSHRWVDVSGHHGSRTQHHARQASHRKVHASERRSRGAHASHRRGHAAASAVQPSARLMRRCHKMSYTQIMRNGSCRDLMRQDLAAATHRHSGHSHRQRSKPHRAHTVRKHHHVTRHRSR